MSSSYFTPMQRSMRKQGGNNKPARPLTGGRAVFQKGGRDGDARAQDNDSLTIFHGKRLSGYAAARGVWRVHTASGDNDVIGNENFGKRVLKGPPLLDTVRLLCYDCRERKEGGYGPKPKLVSLNGGGGGGSAALLTRGLRLRLHAYHFEKIFLHFCNVCVYFSSIKAREQNRKGKHK